jgi:uncharacterized protein YaaQ
LYGQALRFATVKRASERLQSRRPAAPPATRLTGRDRQLILGLVKLVVVVVHNEDSRALIDALLAHEYRATWLHSSGGFLKQSNATILAGVEDAKVEEIVGLVRDNCHARTQTVSPIPPIMEPGEFFLPYPLEVEVGGAVVFVLPVERFERI